MAFKLFSRISAITIMNNVLSTNRLIGMLFQFIDLLTVAGVVPFPVAVSAQFCIGFITCLHKQIS